MIPIDTLVCFNVLFLLSQDLSMIGWLKNNQHLCFCMMAKLLHALSKWSSAKNHRAEEISWWYWTCRINYSSFMPTKAKSVPYCASFIAWRKVSKAGWLKVARTAQATPPCNANQISWSCFSPDYFSTSNISLEISKPLLKWINSVKKIPAAPSEIIKIIHCISKAAMCKSHSTARASVGIRCLWKSSNKKMLGHRQTGKDNGKWNERMSLGETVPWWRGYQICLLQKFSGYLWKNAAVSKLKSFHWQISS